MHNKRIDKSFIEKKYKILKNKLNKIMIKYLRELRLMIEKEEYGKKNC